MKLRYLCFPVLVLLLLIPKGVEAQSAQTLKGDLRAPDASPVPGANVTLTGEALAQPLSSETDEEGVFEFSKVPPGNYVLRANVVGFDPVEKSVVVAAAPLPRIRMKLKISQVAEKVTVSGQSILVAEENPSQAQFNEHAVMNLPTRDADPLVVPSLFLHPAVVGASGPTIVVDGVETSSLDLPTSGVKGVTVDQNPYSAEFGRPGKGRLEVTTRRGVHSRYRGNLLALFRNSALDARNALAEDRPLQQREIGEAEFDGPLGHQTTFLLAGRYHFFNNSAIVHATTPAGTLVENVRVPEHRAYLFGRIDRQLSRAHKVTLLYKFKNNKLDNQGIGGLNLPGRATDVFAHENEAKILETATPSSNLLNQVRFTYRQQRQNTTSISDADAVLVLGAFKFGGAQTNRALIEKLGDVQDVASVLHGRHNFHFGLGAKLRYFFSQDSSNFGGTFIFSQLADFQNTPPRPSEFMMNFGNPIVYFHQHEVFSFFQDEMRLRPDLSLMLGLRHEFQSNVSYYESFAPRLALAYSPGHSHTVFRGGFGIFYDRQPYLMEQDSLLYGGSAIHQIVLSCPQSCPSYPQAIQPGTSLAASIPSSTLIAPGIRFPHVMQGSFAIERKVGRGQNFITLELSTVRGVDLYRTRNLNAPLPGTTNPPNPNFVNIDQFEASASSRSNSLALTYKGQLRKLNIMAQYVLSRTLDDTSGFLDTPANNYNPQGDWGRSDLDRRHRFNVVLIYPLRFGFQASGIVNAWSGLPYNITTGNDDDHDTVFNDRPPGLWRNAGRGAGYANVDLRLSKRWRIRQKEHAHFLEVAWDAFNILNHVNFKDYEGVISSPTFGQPNTANPARQLQVSVRYHF